MSAVPRTANIRDFAYDQAQRLLGASQHEYTRSQRPAPSLHSSPSCQQPLRRILFRMVRVDRLCFSLKVFIYATNLDRIVENCQQMMRFEPCAR